MPQTEHPLAKNNDPPTAQETRSIRLEVDELENQNDKLSRQLASIHARLNDSATRLASLKWILSPIRKVPLEILGEIFLRMPTSQLRPRNYQKHIVRLSLVCKSWRDVVRLTPQLWCDIWVKVDAPGLAFKSLSAWATRGGSLPKTLEITSSVCGPIDRNTGYLFCGRSRCLFYRRALAKFLKHTPVTWHSILLNCPTPYCLLSFIRSLDGVGTPAESNGWESLRSFTMVTTTWDRWLAPNFNNPLRRAFSFIPSSVTNFSLHLPTKVAGWENNPNHFAFSAQLAWPFQIPISLLRGLTHLELHFNAPRIHPCAIFTALQHCRNLETLEIELSSGTFSNNYGSFIFPGEFNMQGMSLPTLRRLRLCQVIGESIEDLQLIMLPNLVDLFISFGADGFADHNGRGEVFTLGDGNDFDGDELDVRALANFIYGPCRHISPSCLQRLHLKGASFLPAALHHIICDLDSLVHLKLEWVSLLEDAQVDFAVLAEVEPARLQRLRTLEVENLKEPGETEVPLLRAFAETQGVDLKLSFYDREKWGKDDRRHLYLVGLDSDSDGDY